MGRERPLAILTEKNLNFFEKLRAVVRFRTFYWVIYVFSKQALRLVPQSTILIMKQPVNQSNIPQPINQSISQSTDQPCLNQ